MKCSQCGHLNISSTYVYVRHLKIFHSGLLSYTCAFKNCWRTFVSIPTLKKHMLTCIKNENFNNATKTLREEDGPSNRKRQKIENTSQTSSRNIVQNSKLAFDKQMDTSSVVSDNNSLSESTIQSSLYSFIGQLYGNCSVPKVLIDNVLSEIVSHSGQITNLYKERLKSELPHEYHANIDKCLKLRIYDNTSIEHTRLQYFIHTGHFIKPKPIKIGQRTFNVKQGGVTVKKYKDCYAYAVPLGNVLKMFLELPNVFKEITDYIKKEMAKEKGIYSSVYNGSRWREIFQAFGDKIVIGLDFYFDEFEVVNPIGVAKGLYEMGGLYYSVAGLHPKYASAIENIFLAQLVYARDLKDFKPPKCFTHITNQIISLWEKGIVIEVEGKLYTVHFVVLSMPGDNKGINCLFGFNESFAAHYYCRFCYIKKDEAKALCSENKHAIRDIESYELDVKLKRCGIKYPCIFNRMPFFHNIKNWTCDLMHDQNVGGCRYDMAKLINYFISKGYFTLDLLNERLKYFDFCESDRGSKITSIKEKHVKDGYLIITAAQMSALISYFGILVGDLVPEDDPGWELYLTLVDIIQLEYASSISEEELILLEQLIKTHHSLYMEVFKEFLIPKDHLITHHPTCMRIMGPLRYLSCNKWESFHQLSKSYARVVNCRKNLIYSLACKLQLNLAHRFYCRRGFSTNVEVKVNPQKNNNNQIDSITINNVTYKKNIVIYMRNDEDGDPIFGIISSIVKLKEKRFAFILKECETLGLINSIKAYQIIMPTPNSVVQTLPINYNEFYRPIKIHVTSEGRHVIAFRDVE